MAIRLVVASFFVATLTYLTSPATASVCLALITGVVLWGQYLSHSDSKYDRIPLDDSAGE